MAQVTEQQILAALKGVVDHYVPVETARTQQRWIQHIWTVRRCYQADVNGHRIR